MAFADGCWAQMDSTLFSRDNIVRKEDAGELRLEIDNVSFFKDNEWMGDIIPGYTLPGLWLEPKVTYNAIPQLRLEAGLHALIYAGTTKYPNTIYQDIAEWKGDQYMSGSHVVPYFRAQVQLSNLSFVLGNIYGGSNHKLPDPLFSSELNLTSDPEMGLQMLFDNGRLNFDVWANWQSFIFKRDYHRESFVFGANTSYKFTPRLSASLAILAHHRGGEIDTITVNSVNTVMNGSFGLTYRQPLSATWIRSFSLSAYLLGYMQQSGKMWPLDKGWAFYAEGRMQFPFGINAKVGYIVNRKFASILSYPHYSCFSLENGAVQGFYDQPQMLNAQLDWTRTFYRNYAIGVRAEMFQFFPHGFLHNIDGTLKAEKPSNSLSFGIFLRATPNFLLYKHKPNHTK